MSLQVKAYVSAPINGMKSNGYSSKRERDIKYYQSRNEKYNHFSKSSININDPNDWPSLGEATTPTTNEPSATTNSKARTNGLASQDTNGTVFKNKKIVQTKNTSTPNGDIVETTVIEETDTFSKLVISKEPSNKDSNNNKVVNGSANSVNDNESSTETSSSAGNLDDSIDVLDEKENSSKCSTTGSSSKKSSTDVETAEDKANKSKKKSSKSKWKVLNINIEQPSRPLMDKRRFERSHRDHYRDHRDRDSRISSHNGGRRREYNNSNGKYTESNGGYYSSRGGRYSSYHNSTSHNTSSNHTKESQIVNATTTTTTATTTTTNENSATANETTNSPAADKLATNSDASTATTNASHSSSTANSASSSVTVIAAATSNTTNQQTSHTQQPNKLSSSNSYNNSYSNGGVGHHRQKRLSGGGRVPSYRHNRSMSDYRQRNSGRMHYDSGNVTPLSDYEYNATSNGGYYLESYSENGAGGHHTVAPHHQQPPQLNNGSNNSPNQNGYVPQTYYVYNAAPISAAPADTHKSWAALDVQLRSQIEYYFSDGNLQRDFFLRRKMDKDGYLPISLIASFYRVQKLTMNPRDIIDSLKKSDKIELSDDNKKVRTKNDPSKWPIMDQLFNFNNNMFELSKGSTSSSCNSKDASTDSANDTSGISFGSTDLHPNVPEFIPGQPYGYLYDGASTCVFYPPTSFPSHKSPIDTSYNLNYQIPYGTAYPLNSTSLTDNCLEDDDSKTMNNCSDEDQTTEETDEIIEETVICDQAKECSSSQEQDDEKKSNDNSSSNQTIEHNQSNESQITADNQTITTINDNVLDKADEKPAAVTEEQENDKEEVKDVVESKSPTDKSNKAEEQNDAKVVVLKEESSKPDSNNLSNSTDKSSSNKPVTNSTSTKDNSSSKDCSTNKENSSTSSSTNSKNVAQQPTATTVPTKVLSYSDAIKLKEKPSNKQTVTSKDEESEVKSDSPNKQTQSASTAVAHSENTKENDEHSGSKSSHHKENRRDRKKSDDFKSSASSLSSKKFHGFKSAKSNRNRSADKK